MLLDHDVRVAAQGVLCLGSTLVMKSVVDPRPLASLNTTHGPGRPLWQPVDTSGAL